MNGKSIRSGLSHENLWDPWQQTAIFIDKFEDACLQNADMLQTNLIHEFFVIAHNNLQNCHTSSSVATSRTEYIKNTVSSRIVNCIRNELHFGIRPRNCEYYALLGFTIFVHIHIFDLSLSPCCSMKLLLSYFYMQLLILIARFFK